MVNHPVNTDSQGSSLGTDGGFEDSIWPKYNKTRNYKRLNLKKVIFIHLHALMLSDTNVQEIPPKARKSNLSD